MYKKCSKFQKETRWPILIEDLCFEIWNIPYFGDFFNFFFTFSYYT